MSQDETTAFACDFSQPKSFSIAPSETTWFEHLSVFIKKTFVRQFLPHWMEVLFPSNQFWCHSRMPTRTELAFDAPIHIPNSVLFLKPIPNRTVSKCLPTIIWQMKHHAEFVQQESLVLRSLTKMLVTCVVADVSKKNSGHSEFENSINPGAYSILMWV